MSRAAGLKDPSPGLHPKIHLAAPAQEGFIGAGEFQNLLADWTYREILCLPIFMERIVST